MGLKAVPLFSPTLSRLSAKPSVTVVRSPNMSWLRAKCGVLEM